MKKPIIVFVHGTGVRKQDSDLTLARIRSHMEPYGFTVEQAPWGDALGSNPAVRSIPDFEKTGGKEPTDEQRQIRTWSLLFADPASELRLLALNKPNQTLPPLAAALDQAIKNLNASPAELVKPLSAIGMVEIFPEACELIRKHDSFQDLRRRAMPPEGQYLDAIASAIVAQMAILYLEKREYESAIATDADLRDALVGLVRKRLGPGKAAPAGRIVELLGKGVSGAISAAFYTGSYVAATPYLKWRRGKHADASPIAGDILLYQARGDKIRGLIRDYVLGVKEPVVLLGHSLGGVACVDLLMDPKEIELHERVKMLATVGSQAPYFYEINALWSLEFGKNTTLPKHFPKWVNVYDRGDFLSYVGKVVFPKRIEDHEVRTGQPFPQSHSAYWSRRETYKYLVDSINKHVL